jgi:PAP2 superfamily
MTRLLVILACVWAVLAATSRVMHAMPVVPWSPGIGLTLVVFPAGFGIWFAGEVLDRVLPGRAWVPLVAGCFGTALLLFWQVGTLTPYIVIGLWGLLIARLALATDGMARKFGWGLVALTLWAAAVPYENYIALKLGGGHFHDATFRAMDYWVLHAVTGLKDYSGAFPLTRDPLLLRVLANGYLTMAFQPFVAILCLYPRRYGLAQLFIAGPACYVIAAAIFAAYPVFGPIFLYADTFDPHMHDSMAWVVSAGIRNELNAALAGSATATGGAYFIGLPSMHVALGTICQHAAWESGAVFWILLPLNIALISSTLLLGFHYLADIIAGLLLGWSVSVLVARWLASHR